MVGSETPPDSATTARDSLRRTFDGARNDKIESLDQTPTLQDKLERSSHKNDKVEDEVDDESPTSLVPSPTYVREFWKFHLRAADDDEEHDKSVCGLKRYNRDWWFASTAIPLVAATVGPLANVMSIAALITSWRNDYNPDYPGVDEASIGYADPHWCIALNAASLVCGFVGNVFLLFNFTRRIRYIVALPMTIILWYFATGILIGITVSMNKYAPPVQPLQTYSQGFWHAVIASALYLIASMMLMINMLGYFLGHYPQHFDLTDEQRNLILQTMMFFVWLAGGAGVFSKVCGWSYVDALYFADVTVLTVGFGDFFAPNDTGRGLVFPYSVGGIIILGLMVSSIRKFARELGHNKVIKHHVESKRASTFDRAVTNSFEAAHRYQLEEELDKQKWTIGRRPLISAPFDPQRRTIAFDPDIDVERGGAPEHQTTWKSLTSPLSPLKSPMSAISKSSSFMSRRSLTMPIKRLRRVRTKRSKLLILREEKDRFDAMRSIQQSTSRFKQYFALSMSIVAFGLLWCVGAVVFWCVEQSDQGLSYFQALYFCYVSLLTIGYGDLAPKSNAGKPFFIVWSLVAVPTMTILVSDMGDTVIASYKRRTFALADWTVLPQEGKFREFLDKHSVIMQSVDKCMLRRAEKKRIRSGFPGPTGDPELDLKPTLEQLATDDDLDEHDLARKLAIAIRRTADDLTRGQEQRYSYEEWVEFSRLIRFSRFSPGSERAGVKEEEEEEGLIDWDWIGEDSPMMAEESECEWVLDRLCESLDRYMRKMVPEHVKERRRSRLEERLSFSRRGSQVEGPRRTSRPSIGGRYSRRPSPSPHFQSMASMRMQQ
ncbi:Potassium channel [Xylographa trunciseda]|nr:Potassium channel [Xylographa trunciseda]